MKNCGAFLMAALSSWAVFAADVAWEFRSGERSVSGSIAADDGELSATYDSYLTQDYVKSTMRATSVEELLSCTYVGKMNGNYVSNGPIDATGYFVTQTSTNELTVELQAVNREMKCVLVGLRLDDDGFVSVKAVLTAYCKEGTTVGTRCFNQDGTRTGETSDYGKIATSATGNGYGIATLSISGLSAASGEASVTKSGSIWTIDTTDGAYVMSNEEIAQLKKESITVILRSGSSNGATIDLGTNTTEQKSRYVVESGRHKLKWAAGALSSGALAFTSDGTDGNPSILVKDGATLDFYAKDVTGWKQDVKRAAASVIKVESGATLNLYKNGNNTWYFQGRFIIEPGATVTAMDFESQKFRLNGGAYADYQQLYVPAPTGSVTKAVYTSNVGFRLAKDIVVGYAVNIEAGATLVMSGGAFTTDDETAEFAKFGEGTLELPDTVDANVKMVLGGGEIRMKTASARTDKTLRLADGLTGRLVTDTEDDWTIYRVASTAVLKVDGISYYTLEEAIHAFHEGAILSFITGGVTIMDLLELDLNLEPVEGSSDFIAHFEKATEPALRFSEIMPKPVDKPVSAANPASLERMDVNGLESGWVELENTSDQWVDLADYRFIRVNRSKKTDPAAFGNLASRMVAPHSRTVFYTSERYPNGDKKAEGVSAFEKGIHDSCTTEIYNDPSAYGVDLHGVMVWPDKINPKKFPFVRLYYAPQGTDTLSVVDTVVIPSDIPEGHSIIIGQAGDDEATQRWMTDKPTRGTENYAGDDLIPLGPNVGPLYEKKGLKKTDVVSEFDRPAAPAILGTDYVITQAVNAVMNPDGTFKPRSADVITKIQLVYRTDLDDKTLKTVDVDMTSPIVDANWGNQYEATIPAADFPAAGHLIQWKFKLTDAAGQVWTSPSFHNKDDGYEWYGTIVEPTEDLVSATLPTWHMFVDAASKQQMDIDADKQNLSVVPHNARVAIYDSTTSNYYDYVRIDLRGNTSATFKKKSHGLRFSKAHPLTIWDAVAGEMRESVRKSSLIGEPADPSRMRQMMSFWLWNKMGNKVPFDFPVRCNLNGEFFQLGFHSERFTDELIEDFHKLDKYGYGYKNVGTLKSASGTTAGGIEKKTPDDGNESDISVLENEFRRPLKDAGVDAKNFAEERLAVTQFVVRKFDLPAWLNYLASARITQEMDDVWANISIYYDNAEMKEGVRGTGTWMPLGYDFNLSLGQWYFNDINGSGATRDGTLMSNQDWFKSHPFYGGHAVRCYKQEAMTTICNEGNRGIEAVLQSPKFRRLYLRRLRTLMDQELGAPNPDETLENTTVPLMVKMKEVADLMRADATLDTTTYPWDSSFSNIDDWGQKLFPETMDLGIQEIWDKYVVPRREHLYVTHSVTNTAKEIGYGSIYNAGIPLAQSPILSLRDKITAEYVAEKQAVVIRNANGETIDLSNWTLEGPVMMMIPAGTVIDQANGDVPGEVFVTLDRRALVAAMDAEIEDQVIVGNATAGKSETVSLTAADGTKVIFTPTPEYYNLRLHSFDGVTPVAEGDTEEWIVLTNISETVTLDLTDIRVRVLKDGDPEDQAKLNITLTGGTLAPGASVKLEQAAYADTGWTKITNNKIQIAVWDANSSLVQSAAVTQKNCTDYYGAAGDKTAPVGGRFYLEAIGFGETLAQGDFKEVPYPSTAPIWGEVTEETALADVIPELTEAQAAVLEASDVTAADIAAWATTKGGYEASAEVGGAIDLVAFALDCRPAEVEEKAEEFRLTISFDDEGRVQVSPTVKLNVRPTVKGSADLKTWHDKTDADRFFKAVIEID